MPPRWPTRNASSPLWNGLNVSSNAAKLSNCSACARVPCSASARARSSPRRLRSEKSSTRTRLRHAGPLAAFCWTAIRFRILPRFATSPLPCRAVVRSVIRGHRLEFQYKVYCCLVELAKCSLAVSVTSRVLCRRESTRCRPRFVVERAEHLRSETFMARLVERVEPPAALSDAPEGRSDLAYVPHSPLSRVGRFQRCAPSID